MPASWQIGGNGRKTMADGVPAQPRPGAVMQPLADRPLGRFARPRRRLRADLVQLLCALTGLGLGLLLPRITFDSTVASTRVTDALVAAGFGVMGLVTVIFSLLFLVVQWAFSSLSPRPTLPAAHRPHPPGHHRAPPPAASRRSPHSALQSRSSCSLLRGHTRPFCPRSYTVVYLQSRLRPVGRAPEFANRPEGLRQARGTRTPGPI